MENFQSQMPANTGNSKKRKYALMIFLIILLVFGINFWLGGGQFFKGSIKLDEFEELGKCISGFTNEDLQAKQSYLIEVKEDCSDKKILINSDDKSKAEIFYNRISAISEESDSNNFTFTSQNNMKNPTYDWDFGDGTKSTEAEPGLHTYAESGEKNVILINTMEIGGEKITLKTSKKINVEVKSKPADPLPEEIPEPIEPFLNIPFNSKEIEGFTFNGTNQLDPKGLSFNGSSDFVESNSPIQFSKYNKLSMAFWFRRNSAIKDWTIIAESSPNFNTNYGGFVIGQHWPKGGIYSGKFNLGIKDVNGRMLYQSDTNPDIGKWYHIIATIDLSKEPKDSLKLYIDGKPDGANWDKQEGGFSIPSQPFPDKFKDYNLYFGARKGAPLAHFSPMSLSDFRFYDRIISPDQAKTLFDEDYAKDFDILQNAVDPIELAESKKPLEPFLNIPFNSKEIEGFTFNGTNQLDPKGLSFNGSSDFVEANSPIEFSKYNKLSMAFWYRQNIPLKDWGVIAGSSEDAYLNNGTFEFGQHRPQDVNFANRLILSAKDTNGRMLFESDSAVQIGKWYHIVATVDRTADVSNALKIYINGNPDGSNWDKQQPGFKAPVLPFPDKFRDYKFYFGARRNFSPSNPNPGYFTPMSLSDFRFYDRIISPDQAKTLFDEDFARDFDILQNAVDPIELAESKKPLEPFLNIPFDSKEIDGFTFNGTSQLDPKGLSFNGSSDFVEANSPIEFSKYNKLSMAFWYRQNIPLKDWGVIAGSSEDAYLNNGTFEFGQHRPQDVNFANRLILSAKDTNGRMLFESDSAVQIGKWYHIVATVDRTAEVSNALKIYINGNPDGSNWDKQQPGFKAPVLPFPDKFRDYKFYFGARRNFSPSNPNPGYFTPMSLSDFRFYDRIISPDQAKSLFDEDFARDFDVLQNTKEKDSVSMRNNMRKLFASSFDPDNSNLNSLNDAVEIQAGDGILIMIYELDSDLENLIHVDFDGKRWSFDVKNQKKDTEEGTDAVNQNNSENNSAVVQNGGGGGDGGGAFITGKKVPRGKKSKENSVKIPDPNLISSTNLEIVNSNLNIDEILKLEKFECLYKKDPLVFADTDDESSKLLSSIGFGENAIVQGFNVDGNLLFRGEIFTNRAEVLKILMIASCTPYDSTFEKVFRDIESTDWHWPYVISGKKQNIVEGYQDGTFRPAKSVSIIEAIKMTAKIAGIAKAPDNCDENPFIDMPDDHWGFDVAREAFCAGIVTGEMKDEGRYLYPDEAMTRAQMAELIKNYYEAAIKASRPSI